MAARPHRAAPRAAPLLLLASVLLAGAAHAPRLVRAQAGEGGDALFAMFNLVSAMANSMADGAAPGGAGAGAGAGAVAGGAAGGKAARQKSAKNAANTMLALADAFGVRADGDKLCSWIMNMNADNHDGACGVISSVSNALLDGVFTPENCESHPDKRRSHKPHWALGEDAAPEPLPDRRPLPASFAEPMEILEEEGEMYHWLWDSIRNLYFWWPCADALSGKLATLVPPGWKGVGGAASAPGLHSLPQRGNDAAAPFMLVLKREEAGGGSHLAVVVRGTNTPSEWRQNLAYNRIVHAEIPGTSASFKGETHAGFTRVFKAMWPAVREALEAELDAGSLAHVTIAGHSLGAGAASLLSYAAAELLKERGSKAVVSAVLFGAPNSGNTKFVEAHSRLVNTRRVTFAHDLVPMLPCSGGDSERGMPACADTPVKTNQRGPRKAWTDYAPHYGSITFDDDVMPVQQDAWAETDRIRLNTIAAVHICSYSCLASRFSRGHRDSRCLLAELGPDDGHLRDSAHTFCPGFPEAGGAAFSLAGMAEAAAAASGGAPAAARGA